MKRTLNQIISRSALFFLLLFSTQLAAQDQPFIGAFGYNWQIINPAAMDKLILDDPDLPFVFTTMTRGQPWSGVEGVPLTTYVSVEHRRLGDGFNLKGGVSVLFDQTDVFSAFTGSANIGTYRYSRGNYYFFGITPSVSRNQLNVGALKFKDQSDLSAVNGNRGKWQGNVGAGFFFRIKNRFFGGVSMPGAIQFIKGKNRVSPYFNTVLGLDKTLSRQWSIQPSIWLRYIHGLQYLTFSEQKTPLSGDVNIRFLNSGKRNDTERYWAGIGYGLSQNLRVEFGMLFSVTNLGTSTGTYRRSANKYWRFSVIANRPMGGYLLSQVPTLEVGVAFGLK